MLLVRPPQGTNVNLLSYDGPTITCEVSKKDLWKENPVETNRVSHTHTKGGETITMKATGEINIYKVKVCAKNKQNDKQPKPLQGAKVTCTSGADISPPYTTDKKGCVTATKEFG